MAYLIINHGGIGGGANGATTAGINTIGANLIIAHLAAFNTNPPAFSDSKSNVWIPLTAFGVTSDSWSRFYYVVNPITDAAHTFSTGTASSFSGVSILALAGASGSPLERETGLTSGTVTVLQAPSITPAFNDEIVVCGVVMNFNTDFNTAGLIDSGFTIADSFASAPAASFAHGLAYKIQGGKASVSPTWSWTTAERAALSIASFQSVYPKPFMTSIGV